MTSLPKQCFTPLLGARARKVRWLISPDKVQKHVSARYIGDGDREWHRGRDISTVIDPSTCTVCTLEGEKNRESSIEHEKIILLFPI